MERVLAFGVTMEDAITGFSGLAAFITVVLVWQALLVKSPNQQRVKELAARRDALRAGMTAAVKRGDNHANSMDLMRRTVNKLKLLQGQTAQRIVDKLAQAGWRSRDAIIVFLFMKIAMPITLTIAAAVAVFVFNMYDLPPIGKFAAVGTAMVLGVYAPEIFVKNASTKRRKEMQKGLPDGLDLLVICAEAGLSMDAAIARVARETRKNCPPLSDELELTTIELGFLPVRRTALDNLSNRAGLGGVRALNNALIQTEKYGTPLAQSLRVLSAEMRNDRLMKAEEKAARLPAMLTVPMILFILPALFVVLIGPGSLSVLDGMSSM